LVSDEFANKNLPDLISLLLGSAREPEAKGGGAEHRACFRVELKQRLEPSRYYR
jgi:hypothetical protein